MNLQRKRSCRDYAAECGACIGSSDQKQAGREKFVCAFAGTYIQLLKVDPGKTQVRQLYAGSG